VTTFQLTLPSFEGTHMTHSPWWRVYVYIVFCVQENSWVELLPSNEWWTIKRESSWNPLWGEGNRIPFSYLQNCQTLWLSQRESWTFFSVLGNLYSHGASHFCNYSRQYKILYLYLFNPLLPQNYQWFDKYSSSKFVSYIRSK